jgi:hypothetical protein
MEAWRIEDLLLPFLVKDSSAGEIKKAEVEKLLQRLHVNVKRHKSSFVDVTQYIMSVPAIYMCIMQQKF